MANYFKKSAKLRFLLNLADYPSEIFGRLAVRELLVLWFVVQ